MKLRITRPTVKHLFYVYWVMFVQVLHFIVLSLSLDWCFKFIKISYVMSCQAYQMIVGLYWMNSVVIHTCARTHSDFTCRYHHNYFWPSYKSYKETYEGSWLFVFKLQVVKLAVKHIQILLGFLAQNLIRWLRV